MDDLIEQYENQIKLLEKRVNELKQELDRSRGGRRDELHIRIAFLNQEIYDMWDAINMMKDF